MLGITNEKYPLKPCNTNFTTLRTVYGPEQTHIQRKSTIDMGWEVEHISKLLHSRFVLRYLWDTYQQNNFRTHFGWYLANILRAGSPVRKMIMMIQSYLPVKPLSSSGIIDWSFEVLMVYFAVKKEKNSGTCSQNCKNIIWPSCGRDKWQNFQHFYRFFATLKALAAKTLLVCFRSYFYQVTMQRNNFLYSSFFMYSRKSCGWPISLMCAGKNLE